MKKTLFLALAFGLTGLSQAAVTHVNGNTHITDTETVPTLSGSVKGVVNVGSSLGSGVVTVNQNWDLPNSLFIGGVGYKTGAPTANTGKVIVNSGATLTVGTGAASAAGSHIDVGNSGQLAGSGELIIDGGTVNGEQLVVGREGGATGIVTIKNGGTLNVNNSKSDTGDDYHGILIYNGTVVVENGELVNEDALTVIASDTDAALVVKDKASLGTVLVGDTASGSTGSLQVDAMAELTVSGDIYVDEKGSLDVKDGSTLTVAEAIPGDIYSGGAIWINNSDKVSVGAGAAMEAAQIELTGSNAKIDVSGADATIVADLIVLNAGTNINLSDCTGSTGSNLQAQDVIFTITGDNYDKGQIHKDGTAETIIDNAIVEMDGSLLNSLVSGNRTITLVSSSDDTVFTDNQAVSWRKDDDITYTRVEDQFGGLVLQLDKTDADHTDKDALVNEIIDSLISPTSTATINTLNGTISALGGLFNVVKSQLQMPHNVEQPVGNVADESRLAYTGRYYVGANRAWVSALGASDRVATDGHGMGYHYVGGGYAVGYDRVVTPEMYVGAALGQMIGKYKSNSDLVKDNQVTFEASLYAHYTHEMRKSDNRFNVDAYIGGGRARNRAHGVLAEGSVDRASGNWDDTTFGCGIKLSYDIVLSDAHIVTPFVGIEGIYAWQDDYTISNGTAMVNYHDGKASLWTVPVGVTYRYIAAIDKTEYLVPHVTVAYLGDISRKEPRVKYDWNSGSGEVRGSRPACSGFEVEAGLTWILNSEWSTGAFYTIDQRRGDCYQQVKGFVSYSF